MNQKKLDYLRSPNSIDSEEYENARKIFKIFAGAPLIEHYSGSEMLQERFYDCKIALSLSLSFHPRAIPVHSSSLV